MKKVKLGSDNFNPNYLKNTEAGFSIFIHLFYPSTAARGCLE